MRESIMLDGATVPFFREIDNGAAIYTFDSSRCGHPEPMINAMIGLQTIQNNEKLVMINSKAPAGLFPRIENDFNYKIEELTDGRFKIIFTKKSCATSIDFKDNKCSGVGCSH